MLMTIYGIQFNVISIDEARIFTISHVHDTFSVLIGSFTIFQIGIENIFFFLNFCIQISRHSCRKQSNGIA